MLTLHHLEYSQSFRILWLLEELGMEYTLKLYERDSKSSLAPADYKAISPLGTSPVITDGDVVLAETNAIVDYILDKSGDDRLRPKAGSPARTRYLFWFHAAQGSMQPMMTFNIVLNVVKTRVPFFLRPVISPVFSQILSGFVKPRMVALLNEAEKDLANGPWFAGSELSAADIVMSYTMESANMRGYITDEHPNCQAWLKRMYDNKAYKVAQQKDGKPSAAFPV